MQKIIPNLWYDTQAKEAAAFYASVFPDSKVTNISTLHDTPSGDCDVVSFQLCGQPFMAISAGPYFKFNPSISFQVKCSTKDEVDALWKKLSPGGHALMELGAYPFSERFGWLADKYGLSWQLMYVGNQPIGQRIMPALMFVGNVCGKAEDAIQHYLSVFKGGNVAFLSHYPAGSTPDKEGTVQFACIVLNGQEFGVMDSAHPHQFAFNEAISFIVTCEDQKEIDYYWSKLSAVPEAEQCGWLKDKFGVSWQVTPALMDELMQSGDQEKIDRVTNALLKMKKLDIAELMNAAEGE